MTWAPDSWLHQAPGKAIWLVVACTAAIVAETIVGTALPFARSSLLGASHASPDMYTWLDTSYTAAKLLGFILTPWVITRQGTKTILQAASICLMLTCLIIMCSTSLSLLIGLRALQGFAAGILLLAAQYTLFLCFPFALQPILQGCYAIGVVGAPVAIAPFTQGWLAETQSWTWIFCSAFLLMAGTCLILYYAFPKVQETQTKTSADWTGISLFAFFALALTYTAQHFSRWNGLDSPIIQMTALACVLCLAIFILRLFRLRQQQSLVYLAALENNNLLFAFCISFVAGAALLGSAFLITSYCLGPLGFSTGSLGTLMFSTGLFLLLSVCINASCIYYLKMPPLVAVPLGILLCMCAMWLLSHSTSQAGQDFLRLPLAIRSTAFGFLFLSLTLIAFSQLRGHALIQGIALFSLGRQIGGIIGANALQRYMDYTQAHDASILASYLTEGNSLVMERLSNLAGALRGQGMDQASAVQTATGLLQKTLAKQISISAYNEAFLSLALLFVCAAPLIICTKKLIEKRQTRIFSE